MPARRHVRQQVTAGRDAYVAGRDLFVVNVGGPDVAELGMPGLLPRDVPAFTGREAELARLARLAGGGRVVVSAIGGTAGVGKTALAVHAAYQLLDNFPDGHLYADLRGYTAGQDPVGPGEVLQVFLRRLGVPADEVPDTVEDRSGLLRQVLAPRRVLMVLDNARTEAQVRPLLPGAGGSLVLVTSRSALPGLEVDERVSLDILPGDAAAAMLAQVTGTARAQAEPQAVAEVARLCGRLPLALRIAGQILATHPAWPVARLALMLAAEQDRLTHLGAGDLQVQAAFEVTYRQLADGDARQFRLLGLHPGPDFTAYSAAALAGTQTEAAEPALDRLAEVHLITEDGTGRFGMHDLVRLYARVTCERTDSQPDRDAAQVRLVDAYAELAGGLDACVDPEQRPAAEEAARQEGWTLPSMPEALARFQAERPGLLAALGSAARLGLDQQVQRLSESMSISLNVLRYLDDLVAVNEAALDAARRSGDRAAQGHALNNLGTAYQELRRFDAAIDCYKQSLTLRRETGDRPGEGLTLNNLGSAYQQQQRFDEAIDCYQQSLAILRETGDRHGQSQVLNNLGDAYQRMRRLDEAVDYCQQSLTLRRETGDLSGQGQTLNTLGEAYQKLRRFNEAVDCYRQCLEISRETGDRAGEGRILNNIGNVYANLRRPKEAIDYYRRSLAIIPEIGDRHDEGQVLGNLGNAYHATRQPGRAAECWRAAAAAMRDAGDHVAAGRLEQRAGSTRSRRHWWNR